MKSTTETVYTLVGGPTGVELVYRKAANDQVTWYMRDTHAGTDSTELMVSPSLLRRAIDTIEAVKVLTNA